MGMHEWPMNIHTTQEYLPVRYHEFVNAASWRYSCRPTLRISMGLKRELS